MASLAWATWACRWPSIWPSAGYQVTGIDISTDKVAAINRGESYIQDVAAAAVAEQVQAGHLHAVASYDAVAELWTLSSSACPRPTTQSKAPDISFIQNAARSIAAHLRAGQLIVLQSTTYPGTTEEDVLPILESSGLTAGTDFHLAFSPERVDPGNRAYTVQNTPKVVGGLTPQCAELTRLLLSSLCGAGATSVSSPRVAEMTKLLENTFRAVNIAMVNELALLCERMGIDIWEVIQAASSKPFGFMPFTPGPGPGGHCIPVDPHYLAWKARQYDFSTRFIELAAAVNETMPYHVVSLVARRSERRRARRSRAPKCWCWASLSRRTSTMPANRRPCGSSKVCSRRAPRSHTTTRTSPHFAIGGDAIFRSA